MSRQGRQQPFQPTAQPTPRVLFKTSGTGSGAVFQGITVRDYCQGSPNSLKSRPVYRSEARPANNIVLSHHWHFHYTCRETSSERPRPPRPRPGESGPRKRGLARWTGGQAGSTGFDGVDGFGRRWRWADVERVGTGLVGTRRDSWRLNGNGNGNGQRGRRVVQRSRVQ
ncbi:hypothetical protein B0H65DRAFT_478147 [Neurospora tetraspora]|uniref:Uncharacterized protein n=1 Tax=Neurospora tetraspora TaxID=94610 RepID=A0AAE0J774_9PEZI|nr:hypothetical protein B0H65DRAFT_478147 [Neurospora tetraspora]